MANKTIVISEITRPSREGGWGSIKDNNGIEYGIAPDNWDKIKDLLQVGQEAVLDTYVGSNGKNYAKPPKEEKKYVGGFGGGKPKDTSGMAIGAALNNAVTLVSSGKVDIKELKVIAKRILDISIELKKEYEGKL
jgi:hypothetical protein